MIAKLEGNNVVHEISSEQRSDGFEELRDALGDEPCYIFYDFEPANSPSKVLFICFSPETCEDMEGK